MRFFPQVNYLALLVALGTDREIAERIERAGFDAPPLKTIQGWRTRHAIPGRWAPLLISFAIDEKLLKNVSALIAKKAA